MAAIDEGLSTDADSPRGVEIAHDAPERAAELGALLVRLLTGIEVDAKDRDGGDDPVAPDLAEVCPGIPDDLASLVYELLDPDPELRLSNIGAIRSRLARILDPKETAAPRQSSTAAEGERPSQAASLEECSGATAGTLTPFIGRESELEQLGSLLTTGGFRLVTLTGLGGVGKSRLALETSLRLQSHFSDGVSFVPLAALTTPAFLKFAIARSLGMSPSASVDPHVQILEFLKSRHILLILDDLDHLRGGLGWLSALLEASPQVRILGTAREPLGVGFERVIELGGLRRPAAASTDELRDFEAVQLFLESARRVNPISAPREQDMPFIAEICRRLEGVPLAIELASAWVSVLSCEQIATEIATNLDLLETRDIDAYPRHRSMRAVFDRSWELLSDEEQSAFRRLAVFRESCLWSAAVTVADTSLPVLGSLARKGLLRYSELGRIELHDLARQYAARKLASAATEMHWTKKRFARFFGCFVASRMSELTGGSQREALVAMDADIRNISQGFLWAVETQDVRAARDFVPGLSCFYLARGRFGDAEEVFGAAMEAVETRIAQGDAAPGAEDLACLLAAHYGRFLFRLGRFDQAEATLTDALVRLRKCGDKDGQAVALSEMGHVARLTGRYRESRGLYEDALALEREAANTFGIARCLQDLGNVSSAEGRYRDAVRFLRESLALSRRLDDQIGASSCLNNLANALDSLGRAAEARHYYEHAVSATRRLGDTQLYSLALANLGNVAYKQGDFACAVDALQEALALERGTGSLEGRAFCLSVLGDIAHAQGRELDARDLLEHALAISRQTGDRSGMAYILNSLGSVTLAMGDFVEATERCTESVGIFEEIGEQWGLALALQGLADTDVAQGRQDTAMTSLRRALDLSFEMEADALSLDILVTWASWLEASGDAVAAATIARLVSTHPGTEVQTTERALRLLERLRNAVDNHLFESACTAAEQESLQTAVARLLAAE